MTFEKYTPNFTLNNFVKVYSVSEKGFFWKQYDFVDELEYVEFSFKPSVYKLAAITATGEPIGDMYKYKGSCIERKIQLNSDYFDGKLKYNQITFTPTLVPALGYPYSVKLVEQGQEKLEFFWTRKNLIGCIYEYTSKSQPDVVLAEFKYQIGYSVIGTFKLFVDMNRVDKTVAVITLAYVLQRNPTAECPTEAPNLN